MHQALGLSPLLAVRIIRCVRPVPCAHQSPVHELVPIECAVTICQLSVVEFGVTVAGHHNATSGAKSLRCADQVNDALCAGGLDAQSALCDRIEHGTSWSEVERHIVGKCAARPACDHALGPSVLDVAITDLNPFDVPFHDRVVW